MQNSMCSQCELTAEQLENIDIYAYDLMNWKEIAFLLKYPIREFKKQFDNQNSLVYLAYQSGRTRRKHELHVPILAMAVKGSPQAELLAMKFLDEQLIDESDE